MSQNETYDASANDEFENRDCTGEPVPEKPIDGYQSTSGSEADPGQQRDRQGDSGQE